MLNWMEEVEGLSSAALTVQAQAISINDQDELLSPPFFPGTHANSVKLQMLFETDRRYVADRREWNARGRYIPLDTPPIESLTMVPVESYDKIAEEEQQALREGALGNEAIFRQAIGASVPARVDKLVLANFRRIDMDAFQAWATGQITAKNPANGQTHTVDLGFDADRMQEASAAWTDSTAYDELIAWLEDGESVMGPIGGVMLRRNVYKLIRDSAPNPNATNVRLTRAQLETQIADDLGHAFRFYVNETTFDVFDDGGTAVTRTNLWQPAVVAAVPASGVVGATHRAPVVRAMELASQVPGAGIDVRGMTVYYDYENGGRTAVIECQANHLALPAERNVWTIDSLVS